VRKIFEMARFELAASLRTKRAIALVAIYLVTSLFGMSGAITALGKMEEQLATILQVDTVEGKSGVVSATLWKSKPFQKLARGIVGDSLVYDDIVGKHPAELIYAWIVFLAVPFLSVLASCRRVADDVKSGAAKYVLLRVTRLQWTIGKYLGQAFLMLAGLLVGAVGAWCVAAFRLSGADIPALLPAMVFWSLKAWFLSLAWLGVALGISHISGTGAKAQMFSIGALVAFAVAPYVVKLYADTVVGAKIQVLTLLFPSVMEDALWRASFAPVAAGAAWLVALGLMWLSFGHMVFARRDVR
jgi:ABC-type transport system involved in multi-copper enzyme maturation permease subunit